MAVIEASTKAGKTVGALTWIVERALTSPPGSWLWVASVDAQAKLAYRRLKRWLMAIDPGQAQWTPHETEMYITLPGKPGAEIWFKSGDKPDSIYGADYMGAVVDEGSRCKDELQAAVESTLTATGGPLRVIGNVKGRGNWMYRMARMAQSGTPGMSWSKLTAYDAVDAGILRADVIADRKLRLPDHVFRELYLAEPSDDGGNPFGLQHIEACTVVGDMDGDPVAYGVDLAKSHDWTVVVGLSVSGDVCRFARWQHEPWDRTEARILEMIGDAPALVDSTGVGDPIVERLQATAPNVAGLKFTSTSKQQLMEGLASAIQGHRTRFPEGPISEELGTFEYLHKRTTTIYSAPAGLHDDCVCGLALAVMQLGDRTPIEITVAGIPKPRVLDTRDPRVVFEERRQDPNFGFGPPGGGKW